MVRELTNAFVDAWLASNPVRATAAGEHRHDGLWPDPSADGEARWLAALDRFDHDASALLTVASGSEEHLELEMVRSRIAQERWTHDVAKESESNPLRYTTLIGDGLSTPFVGEAETNERASGVAARLRGVPSLLATARRRLRSPPRLRTMIAAEQQRSLRALLDTIEAEARELGPRARREIVAAIAVARPAIDDFGSWLVGTLLPRSEGAFRLGREEFEARLRLVLEDPSVDSRALAEQAEDSLQRTRAEMVRTAKGLWRDLFGRTPLPVLLSPADERSLVRRVIEELANDRLAQEAVTGEVARIVDEAAEFVRAHDLVSVPHGHCGVVEMPGYSRGLSLAYSVTSGPFEREPRGFLVIATAPPRGDSPRELTSHHEYTRPMLVNLVVHEAMPGHFLQRTRANRVPSRLRALFSNPSFVEGWAVYAEWLLAERGFGGPRVALVRQKLALRVAMNAILDRGVHADALRREEAIRRMQEDALEEDAEARGKWRRACLGSGQLSTYFYGFRAMMQLRERAVRAPGFREREFHDRLLSHGAPPPHYLDRLMFPV